MAITNIVMENGFFVGAVKIVGRAVKCEGAVRKLEPTYVSTYDGWECFVHKNGAIECWCYNPGVGGSMLYTINQNGYEKLTLQIEGEKRKILRKRYVLKRGQKLSDGIIGLVGGKIEKRYAYFHDMEYQDFLDSKRIISVKHENPNQIYRVRSINCEEGRFETSLLTDGLMIRCEPAEICSNVVCVNIPNRVKTWTVEEDRFFRLIDATWAIYEKKMGNSISRVLYTLEKNVTQIKLE